MCISLRFRVSQVVQRPSQGSGVSKTGERGAGGQGGRPPTGASGADGALFRPAISRRARLRKSRSLQELNEGGRHKRERMLVCTRHPPVPCGNIRNRGEKIGPESPKNAGEASCCASFEEF
jgi:hypothetical protein